MILLNIGYGNMVSADRIVAVISPESAPVKRIVQEAKENSMVIDATQGKKTKSVIITDSDHVILSAVSPMNISKKISDTDIVEEVEENDE